MKNRRSCVLILLDGLGDRSHDELGGLTPLQAARTPALDYLAARGANGLFHASTPGMALPSENAHYAMFGYQEDEFPGRGLLEALGAGVTVDEKTVVMLAHFVSVNLRGNILELAADRPVATDDEVRKLLDALPFSRSAPISVAYHQTKGLDGILTMRGNVSALITDVDCLQIGSPLIEPRPLRGSEDDHAARSTAAALKDYLASCFQRLDKHPVNASRKKKRLPHVNALVTQRPGKWREIESFSSRWGLRGLSVSSGIMYHGLARFLGMDLMTATDSGEPGNDLAERLKNILVMKADYDFFHVHSKAPDQAAHTKNPMEKVKAIESLDHGIGKVLDLFLDQETVLVIAADHSTPSSGPQVHSGEEVPISVNGPGIRKDRVEVFDEVSCAQGCLGQTRGKDFMPMVLNWLDRAKLHGLRDTPDDQPYWPGRREPFTIGE